MASCQVLLAAVRKTMANNIARAQSLCTYACRNRLEATPPVVDPEIAPKLESIRTRLAEAVDDLDALQAKLTPVAGEQPLDADRDPLSPSPSTTYRTDVLIHNVASPALARSAQAHLAGHHDVQRADVRELAEGLLRITVEGSTALTAAALDGWEPHRSRRVRTEHPGVLEIELL